MRICYSNNNDCAKIKLAPDWSTLQKVVTWSQIGGILLVTTTTVYPLFTTSMLSLCRGLVSAPELLCKSSRNVNIIQRQHGSYGERDGGRELWLQHPSLFNVTRLSSKASNRGRRGRSGASQPKAQRGQRTERIHSNVGLSYSSLCN